MAAYRAKQQDCIKQLNIPADTAAQITSDKEVTNPSEAYKCFHQCLYQKLGLVSSDNKANDGAILKLCQVRFPNASQDKIKQALQSCGASAAKSSNDCEFVYNFELCMLKALK